jgi:nicotinate-nucleotide pyrophosphorylase (carboxylating)
MLEFNGEKLTTAIKVWLEEDVGMGDVSTLATIPHDHYATAFIHAKQAGVIAGLPIAERVFRTVDESLQVKLLKHDGEHVNKGDHLLEVYGSTRSILTAERLALNLLQRLSGVATMTAEFVVELNGLSTRLVDTRKTTPGLRMLEKYAVRVGGGYNHRYGLFDAVMIKDNHIKAAGGLSLAIEKARAYVPHTMKIEVEIERLDQIDHALDADIIMLDNMSPTLMTEAVQIIRSRKPHIIIEASGNVSRLTLRSIALTGVDVISAGSITHSVPALDISLDLFSRKGSNG